MDYNQSRKDISHNAKFTIGDIVCFNDDSVNKFGTVERVSFYGTNEICYQVKLLNRDEVVGFVPQMRIVYKLIKD